MQRLQQFSCAVDQRQHTLDDVAYVIEQACDFANGNSHLWHYTPPVSDGVATDASSRHNMCILIRDRSNLDGQSSRVPRRACCSNSTRGMASEF